MSPQLTQSDHGAVLAKATVTSFTATANINVPPGTLDDPGTVQLNNGVVHTRGLTITGPIIGDITGTVTLVINADIILATGKGPVYWTFVINTTDGSWGGRFEGQQEVTTHAVQTVHFQGQGTGGLAGTKIRGTANDETVNGVVEFTGVILNP